MDIRQENDPVASSTAAMNTFADLAKEEFAFLSRRGFSVFSDSPGEVRFHSKNAAVSVTWDRRSGELDVYLEPLRDAETDKPYSLRDVLAMHGAALPEARQPFQVSELGKLQPFLHRLADDVSEYASEALAGDRMYYRRLSEFRSKQAQNFMRDMQVRRARANAAEAWKGREYGQVVEQFESIMDDLTPAERKKLEVARDRMR